MQNNQDKPNNKLVDENSQLKAKILALENSIEEIKNNYNKNNDDKIDFLKNINHNIRISLNGIVGMTELLKQTDVDNTQKDYIKVINNSSNSLLNTVNKIFDFLAFDDLKIEVVNKKFNIEKLIADAVEHFSLDAEEKNIILSYKTNKNITENLIGDTNHFTQIIYNLLSVLIFNSKDGKINIEISNLITENNKQKIKFKIINSCISLNNENNKNIDILIKSSKLINPFSNIIIGINIINTKKIIKSFNEELFFDYKNENESEFIFTFSFEKIIEKPIIKNISEKENGLAKKIKILIVEDNLLNRKFAIAILKKAGYELDIAENGKIGVEKFIKNKYDLILMDIQMPIMDGIIATKEIRKIEEEKGIENKIIIIAVTAYALDNDRKNCLEAGMDGYISKPYKPIELKNIINKFFD